MTTESIDILLINARTKLNQGDLSAALIWAGQLAVAQAGATQLDERRKVNAVLAEIALTACRRLLTASLRSGGVYERLENDAQVLEEASEALLAFAKSSDSGIAGLTAHAMVARAKTIAGILAEKKRRQALTTSARELDTFLEELWEVGSSAASFAGTSDEIIDKSSRVKMAETALSNAGYELAVFSIFKRFNDWDKAMVYCRHVREKVLPGLEIHHVASASRHIDEALAALEARDHNKSKAALKAAHEVMKNYTWNHAQD
ncbi:MAG: hypothetical protein IPM23_01980 [Candidatus Melainabacteria bacterium]|nr:hypothetical protein [Candidatus Melainabacteria bacterium]